LELWRCSSAASRSWPATFPRVARRRWIRSSRCDANRRLRERFSVQREQAAPRLLRLRLVVDAPVGRTPAVRGAGVDFDLGRQARLAERLLQHVLLVGRALIVVLRDLDEELRLGLRRLQVRTVRLVGDESAAVERRHRADAIGYGGRGAKRDRTA